MRSAEAELRAQRPRRAASTAICLALWGAVYAVAGERTLGEVVGDILGLVAFGLAIITPWTAAQVEREARRRG